LLDEPIAHLDAKLRHRMRGELKRIQMDLGITTVYATPDQLEALSLAQRLAVLNRGRIEQTGTPEDVFERPSNIFVARFVGDPPMNIVDIRVEAGAIATLMDGQVRLHLTDAQAGLLSRQAGEKGIKLGIRPKDLQVLPESADQALLRAEIQQVQVQGETSVLTLRAGALDLRAKLATDLAPARGSNVRLFIDIAKCHFFDSATQLRIGQP
jgi:multiple sugar transport system ATP-binding protein